MRISIIIPTIRSGKLVDFQLPSFAKQTFPKEKFEIVIVDDCPISRKDQIENFGRSNGLNIKWMRSKKPYYRSNASIGCARNTGLIHAEGDLIIFIDDFSYIKPKYLEKVWDVYRNKHKTSHIGPVMRLEHREPPYTDNIDSHIIGKDPRRKKCPCLCGWFFTSNASAPLESIIKVNGFWEIADLTREEDVLMGLSLDRVGRKFCFSDDPDMAVYHMTHDAHAMPTGKFKDISYSELGWENVNYKGRLVHGLGGKGRCGLNTGPNEIQRVTRDVFGTKFPGSWALTEHFKKHKHLKFNEEIGFDLKKERKKIGNWT